MSEQKQLLCFSPEGFQRFLSVLRNRFGSAGDSILYSMARDFGIHDSQQMLKSLSDAQTSQDERAIVTMLLNSIADFGWGKHEIEKFDLINGEILITISETPLIKLCRTKDSTLCYFIKGVLSGMLYEVTEIEFRPITQICKEDNGICTLTFQKA